MGNLVTLDIDKPEMPALETTSSPASRLVVVDSGTLEYASALIGDVKSQWKALDAKRQELKSGPLKACRDIDAFFKPALDYLSSEEQTAKSKVAGYLAEQAKARAAAEEEARKAVEAERAKHEAAAREAAAAGDLEKAAAMQAQAAMITAPVVAPVEKTAGIAAGGRWVAEVTDKMALLRFVVANPAFEYLVDVNGPALRTLISGSKGKQVIPGVTARKEVTVRSVKPSNNDAETF